MDIEAEIEKAVQIGQRNKEVIELVQNWCAHAEVGQNGGIGLVEIQTGLPIGMRFFKCKYARAQGMAGMLLDEIAVDFYDRNCVDCKQRSPVRLPNLSELVAKRDAARARQKEAQTKSAEAEAKAFEERANRRSKLSEGSDPARADIFAAIDVFDRQPTEEHRRVLLGMAGAVPEQFNGSLQDALHDVVEAGGSTRTEAALEVLDLVATDKSRLCGAALRAFGRRDGNAVAGSLVEKHLGKEHAADIEAAVPAILALASPVDGFFPGSGSSGDPRALVRAYPLFREVVTKAISEQLRSPREYVRIQACNAISLLLAIDASLGRRIVGDVIHSLGLPEERYGGYRTAKGSAVSTIADVMVHYPSEVDAEIQRATQGATEEVDTSLVDVYDHVLRAEFEPPATEEPNRAVELAYQRFVNLIANRVENERLEKAVSFLRHHALRYPGLLEKHAETLLGSAALISGDLEKRESPLVDLSLKPDPLKQMEAENRRQMLGMTLEAIVKPVGELAARKPESIGKLLVTTFDALGDGHNRFKAGLTKSLGHMASSPEGSRLALPGLYQAMTNASSLVRAAGAEAYSELAAKDPEDLPSLVHETFLLLLSDPYVIVHGAAVEALRKVSLPVRYNARVMAALAVIVSAYHQSRENDDLISACLERVLELQVENADSKPNNKLRQNVLSIVTGLKLRVAARFVARNGYALRGTPGLGKVLVKLLAEPDLADYDVEDLVEELAEVPDAELLEFAKDFRTVATTRAAHGRDLTNELLEILSRCGAWTVAADMTRDATARLSDTAWDVPRKLRTAAREIAAGIEAAAAASNVDEIARLTDRWRAVEDEIRNDDEQNKKKRDPLLGLSLENPGE